MLTTGLLWLTGSFSVTFWYGALVVSGRGITLPEGKMVPTEKGVGKSEVKFWNGASVVSGLGAKLPEGRMVPAEKGTEKVEDAELEEDSLEEAVEITTLTNSVGPKNRWEVAVAPSLVGPVGVRNGCPAEKEPEASPPVGCSDACELSLL